MYNYLLLPILKGLNVYSKCGAQIHVRLRRSRMLVGISYCYKHLTPLESLCQPILKGLNVYSKCGAQIHVRLRRSRMLVGISFCYKHLTPLESLCQPILKGLSPLESVFHPFYVFCFSFLFNSQSLALPSSQTID